MAQYTDAATDLFRKLKGGVSESRENGGPGGTPCLNVPVSSNHSAVRLFRKLKESARAESDEFTCECGITWKKPLECSSKSCRCGKVHTFKK